MKRCPQCNRTYEDAKNFCLQDGTPLVGDAPAAQPPPQPQPPGASPYQGAPQQQAPTAWSQAGGWQPQPPGNLSGAPTGKRRRAWPWVLGVLAVVLLGGTAIIGGIGYFVYKNVREATRNLPPKGGGPVRADTKTFVNSRDALTGKLAEHYSDFSFDYPDSWELKESAKPGGSNFVKVERSLDGAGDFTLENFAVGWYTSTGTMAGDAPLFPQLVRQLSAQFAPGFPGYKKVSEGRTRVGKYDGYEFRFTAKAEDTPKGDLELYGRAVLIPSGSATQRNGVALIMLATSLAPEIGGPQDVGVRGELPVVLDSFRLGADAAKASAGDAGASDSDETEKAIESAARGIIGGGDEGAPGDKDEVLAQLKEIEEEWARANIGGDKEAARRILADEYVGTSADGKTERKAEYIRNLKPSTEIVSPQEFEDLSLVLAGGRAILSGVTAAEFKDGQTRRFRFVDIFVWRDGRWQAVTSTSTEAG
jgi:hypothetical protein